MSPFLLMPILAGLSVSITSGIVGTYVVVRRIVFIAGSISHAVLGGMGVFLWIGTKYDLPFLTPLSGALVAALLAAAILGWTHLKYKEREDSIIAGLWAAGMSIGIIFITHTPGYNTELMNFLFGNILWTTRSDLLLIAALDGIVVLCTLLFYRKFQAICFDEEQAAIQGTSVKSLYILLLALVALAVVVLIQVVGSILVISMLSLPSAIASRLSNKLSVVMKRSIFLSMLFSLLGTQLSYICNWPPGAAITLLATLVYAISLSIPSRFLR